MGGYLHPRNQQMLQIRAPLPTPKPVVKHLPAHAWFLTPLGELREESHEAFFAALIFSWNSAEKDCM